MKPQLPETTIVSLQNQITALKTQMSAMKKQMYAMTSTNKFLSKRNKELVYENQEMRVILDRLEKIMSGDYDVRKIRSDRPRMGH